jgi:hypothetical protein
MSDTLEFDAPAIGSDSEVRSLTVPFEVRNGDDGDGLTLSGYAAVFNSPTRIADRNGEYTESIAPGAFKRTLNSHKPVMQFDHGQHPLLGSLPIAAINDVREDSRGLYVEARVFDNWLTEPLRDAIRGGAITGMSFKFQVIKDDWRSTDLGQARTIREVKLYELGPVVHPAYADTSVALRSLERVIGQPLLSPTDTSEQRDDVPSEEPVAPADPAPCHSVSTKAQRAASAVSLRVTPRKETT